MTAKYEKEYIGQWKFEWLPKPLYGVLNYDDQERTLILKVQVFYERGSDESRLDPMFFREHYRDMGMIVGNVRYGGSIVLCGTRGKTMGGGRGRGGRIYEFEISAKYAFRDCKVGRGNVVRLKCAKVDFGEILGWTRTSAFQIQWGKRRQGKEDDSTLSHRWKSVGVFGYSFPLPGEGKVTFAPYASYPGDVLVTKTVSHTQGVSTSFRYESSKAWDVIRDDINLVRYLIEFATSGRVGIDAGSFSQARDKWFVASFQPENYKQIIFGDRVVGPTKDPYDLNIIFTLPELLGAIKCHKRSWRKRFDSVRVALKLFDEVIRIDPDEQERRFVCWVQLLEHLHSLIYTDKTKPYYRRMVEVWGDSTQLFNEEKARLCGTYEPSRPNLKMRIYEMLRINGRWLVDNPIGKDGIAFAETVANTRHYFTHHNLADKPKSFDEEKVESVSEFLKQLVRFHILKVLGFSENFALRRMGWNEESSHELFALKHTPIGKEKINV